VTAKSVIGSILYRTNFYRYRIVDVLMGRYDGDFRAVDGYYRISPDISGTDPFWYPLHVGKRHRRDRIEGTYESEVFQTLVEYADENTSFWEVGAWRGYFSLALANTVQSAVAFETRESPVEKLRAAADRNGFQNLRTVNELVESLDPYLASHGTPDLVLLDIEGWEYEVLDASPEFLESRPIIIVELHKESGWQDGEVVNPKGETETVPQPNIDSEGVEELLREHEYQLETLHMRRETNYHILATPNRDGEAPTS